jgi:hypothetical protein
VSEEHLPPLAAKGGRRFYEGETTMDRKSVASDLVRLAKAMVASDDLKKHATDAVFNVDQAVGHLATLVQEMEKDASHDKHLAGLLKNEIDALGDEARTIERLRSKI